MQPSNQMVQDGRQAVQDTVGAAKTAANTVKTVKNVKKTAKKIKNTAKKVKEAASKDGIVGIIKFIASAVAQNWKEAIALFAESKSVKIAVFSSIALSIFIPIAIMTALLTIFPSDIAISYDYATTAGNKITIGLETLGAGIGNIVQDFSTFLQTGTWGTEGESFKFDRLVCEDPAYEGYYSTSDTLLALLNNYFRDAYKEKAKKGAERSAKSRTNQRAYQEEAEKTYADMFKSSPYNTLNSTRYKSTDITYTYEWDEESQDYVDWSITILCCSSVQDLTNGKESKFSAADLLNYAKELCGKKTTSLWVYKKETEIVTGTTTRQEIEVQTTTTTIPGYYKVIGTFIDANGVEMENKIWVNERTVTTTTPTVVSKTYPTVECIITYRAEMNPDAKDLIIEHFGISEEKNNQNGIEDISDRELLDIEIDTMTQTYNSILIGIVTSATANQAINRFYNEHSDMMFTCENPKLGYPNPTYKSTYKGAHPFGCSCSTHGGSHEGIDVPWPDNTQLYFQSTGILVGYDSSHANVSDTGKRAYGNFAVVYYGETAEGGLFCLYGHLATVSGASEFTVYNAGQPFAQVGHSGYSFGAHLHLSTFIRKADGTIVTVNPENYIR